MLSTFLKLCRAHVVSRIRRNKFKYLNETSFRFFTAIIAFMLKVVEISVMSRQNKKKVYQKKKEAKEDLVIFHSIEILE